MLARKCSLPDLVNILVLSLVIGLVSSLAYAGGEMPESPDEIQDSWSSIFYCQEIYREPDVKRRIYPGDLQSCEKSNSKSA